MWPSVPLHCAGKKRGTGSYRNRWSMAQRRSLQEQVCAGWRVAPSMAEISQHIPRHQPAHSARLSTPVIGVIEFECQGTGLGGCERDKPLFLENR